MIRKSFTYIFIGYFIIITWPGFAQRDTTLRREVEVVKAYDPTISDANKISSMPKIEDTGHKKPDFNYSIFSQPVFNTFSVNTLKAATFSSHRTEEEGFGMIQAGIGNYNRPYGELFFNGRNLKNTIFGLHGRHLSSHGRLTLEGGDRVNAPFSENQAEMFVKHFFNNSVLSVKLDFNRNGFRYYGYPGDSIPGVLKNDGQDINFLGSGQAFSKGGLKIDLKNTSAGADDFVFDFDFLYHYFGTRTGQREHFGEFIADVRKPYDKGTGFLKAGVMVFNVDEIFNRYMMDFGEKQQIWLTAQPSYRLGGDIANIELGAKGWFILDNNADAIAKLAPNIKINFVPVKEIISIYAGVDGNYIPNYYSRIAYENPFADPFHDVKNTHEQLHFFGGFDGKFSSNTNFKISAGYSMLKDKPFYYLFKYLYQPPGSTSSLILADNDFDILYDDCDLLKFNLEIFHTSFEKINLLLSGNYYMFTMKSQKEPWNLPSWDAKFSFGYEITKQLDVSVDLFFTGSRKALVIEVPVEDPRPLNYNELLEIEGLQHNSHNLPTIFDLNFNAAYKITERFSIFTRLNNFGFRKYQRWFGYPVQSFNVLGGLSYSF
jgi:hypothetical protein